MALSESRKKWYEEKLNALKKEDQKWEQSRQEYWASRPKPLPTVTRVNKVDVQDERAAQSRARVKTANQRMANLSAKQSGLLPLGSGERMEDVNSELSALRHEQDLVSQYNNDLPYQLKRGWSLGTESAGTALLGAAEGLTDIIGSGFYAGLSGLTSLGGLAPNPVSEWALEQGQAFLDNSVTRDWEKSIEERYNPTDAEKRVLGIGKSVAQMLPAIGVSKVVGAAQAAPKAVSAAKGLLTDERVGQALFGLQAAGNAASQAKQEGAGLGQSVAYGAASGLTESLIERVSGGIPGLGKGVLDDVAARVASNPIVRNAVDILGEGGEEAVSAMLDPYLRRAIYDPDAENATPEEIAEAAVTGAIAAGVLKGGIELPTAVGNTVSRVRTVRDSVGTNQDIAARVNAGIAEGNGPFRPYEPNRTESKTDRVPGEYRAETPQNVEYPTVPIINLSMQNVADMNGGDLPESGNYIRKTAFSDTASRLGLDQNEAAYIEANNVTRNGDAYVLKVTKSSLKKMLSASSYPNKTVPLESIAVLQQLERIAQNGVYYKSNGDRKGRDQIAGYDHLMTTVYIDSKPYVVDMRVRVDDQKSGGSNRLYYFTPEAISVTNKNDGTTSTAGRRATSVQSTDVMPSSTVIIPQNQSHGNQRASSDIGTLRQKTSAEVQSIQRPLDSGARVPYDGGKTAALTGRQTGGDIYGGTEEALVGRHEVGGYDPGGAGGPVLRERGAAQTGDSRADRGNEAIPAGRPGPAGTGEAGREITQTARSWQEDPAAFAARSSERGGVVRQMGNVSVAYRETEPVRWSPHTRETVEAFREFGIEPRVVDFLERNSNGYTSRSEEAVTSPEGEVYLIEGSGINGRQVAAHEALHKGLREKTLEALAFRDAVLEADFFDEAASKYVAIIRQEYFDKRGKAFDPVQDADKLYEEFASYMSGFLGDGSARERLGAAYADFDALERQWQAMKAAMGGKGQGGETAGRVPPASPESSVGAAAYGFDPYTNLQGRYGTIQPGENPARVVDVPSRTEDHNKVSLTARTVMEAAATPDAAVPVIAQMVVDGRFSHIPVSNAQRAEMAENRIQKTGYQDALSNWRADVRAGKSSADITAMGAQLYNAAVNAGRTGEAMGILYDYTQAIRAGAQATQAARILKTLTPSGRLYMLQKEVNNLNDKLSEKQKKAAGKKQSVSAEDNVPVELWMQRVGETLADRLASRVNAPKETTRTVAQTVLSDLQRYANETAPKSLPTGKKRTEMDRIMDLFQNRTAYEEAWQAAKDTLSDQFEDNPEALAAFDEWLDSSLDYTKVQFTRDYTG